MIALCPPKEKLQALSLGQLNEEQSDALIVHLEGCDACQAEITKLDESQDTLVSRLRSEGLKEGVEFQAEDGCRIATARALAALAQADCSTTEALSNVPSSIGEYDIVRPLGRGGMGHVYLGQHTKLGRPVAIKFVADHRRWDRLTHERFASEMKLIGGLNHPNIVVAHDAREVDGLAVLVTEFIDGLTLSEILKRVGKVSVENAASIVSQVCDALSYIDEKGLVHRDIKPSNIMIDNNGVVKLLDLGLARVQFEDNEIKTGFTATGQAMGTADYVAPEQITDGKNVGIKADLYGLGCTTYKLLSGRAPFANETYPSAFAKMNAHVNEVPESLSGRVDGLPIEVVKLVDKMLEKNADSRPKSPQAVAESLNQFSTRADLAALVEDARLRSPSLLPNEPIASSKPQTKIDRGSKTPWGMLVAVAMAGIVAGLFAGYLLGIKVTVKKQNGTTSTVIIPDGSTAVIDAEGNVEIQLAGTGETHQIPKALVTNNQPSSSKPDESRVDPRIAAESGAISQPTNQSPVNPNLSPAHSIQRKSSARICSFQLDESSPLFQKVEKGDWVDVFVVKESEEYWPSRSLIARVQIFEVHDDDKIVFYTYESQTEIEEVLDSSRPVKLSFDFQDPDRQIVEDNRRLDGVWLLILQKIESRVVDVEDMHTLVVHRSNLIALDSDGYNSFEYELTRNGEGGTIRTDSDTSITYRFLESGRLELASGSTITRYERVNEARNPLEKSALNGGAEKTWRTR